MDLYDRLKNMNALRAEGILTEEEFVREKERILNEQPYERVAGFTSEKTEANDNDLDEEKCTLLIHLSILSGFVIPFAGIVIPTAIWVLKKDESELVDVHGRIALNWIISSIIYFVISLVLMFFVIGIFGFLALLAVGIIFPIIAAIKSTEGEIWEYPWSIRFFKIPDLKSYDSTVLATD